MSLQKQVPPEAWETLKEKLEIAKTERIATRREANEEVGRA